MYSLASVIFLHFRATRRWETLKYEVMQIEQARRSAQHRSTITSSTTAAANDPNIIVTSQEENKSTRSRHRSGHVEEEHAMVPLTRLLPERLIEKTREKHTQRVQYRKRTDLKLAFSEFYLMLVLLQNYQTLNFVGFRKILKKHDKLFETTRGDEWR